MSDETGTTPAAPPAKRGIKPLEIFLLVVGVAVLIHGLLNQQGVNIFFGVVIIPGVFVLRKVRTKDWAKHWQEIEEERNAREVYAKRVAEAKAAKDK